MGSDSNGSARATWWERWAPASGAVAVILMVIAFLVAGSSPDPDDPATEIASYLASDSNQNQNFAAFFVFLAGVLFLLVFFSVLRSRLAAAEGPGGGLAPLAFGSGVASGVLWIGAVSFFVAPLAAADNRGTLSVPQPTSTRSRAMPATSCGSARSSWARWWSGPHRRSHSGRACCRAGSRGSG